MTGFKNVEGALSKHLKVGLEEQKSFRSFLALKNNRAFQKHKKKSMKCNDHNGELLFIWLAKKDNLILLKLMEKLLSFGAEKKQLHITF